MLANYPVSLSVWQKRCRLAFDVRSERKSKRRKWEEYNPVRNCTEYSQYESTSTLNQIRSSWADLFALERDIMIDLHDDQPAGGSYRRDMFYLTDDKTTSSVALVAYANRSSYARRLLKRS
jgi:hypothetical protein